MRCTACLFWVVSMSLFSTSAASEPVPTKADEVVHLFPAYATLKSSGDWHTAVRGWVFEPEEDSMALLMGAEQDKPADDDMSEEKLLRALMEAQGES